MGEMTRAEELWREFRHDGWIGPTAFKAALLTYGQEVRKRDAEVCRKHDSRSIQVKRGGKIIWESVCTAAIEREELP